MTGAAIDYGDEARIGVIVPSGNVVAEAETHAMLPAGVRALFTRLPLRSTAEAELLAMAAQAEGAAALLADALPAVIAFHCTAATTFSDAISRQVGAGLQAGSRGIASFQTGEAIVAALAALGARRIVLLTPYPAEVNRREAAYLENRGIEVLAENGLGIATNTKMARLPPQAFIDQALRHRHPQAEAYFISCTAIRSAGCIAPLEQALGRPVITSNQALVWQALQRCGAAGRVAGYGALLGG
ncbi:hypothetical protein GT347_01925 [Xylophilus rhododendri]|uniref:Arylmalonate decarboxylase n=1 Tax=Xylophilus rhododendri TaxID=2697032 RepID=A0A857IZG3_9BURK|nr:aspartate/glutamate racemase family protein [Xylophilus rhododendri]QHI96856.1 hypothetical protein GT347_01925 [Xylophilus rhododendri]